METKREFLKKMSLLTIGGALSGTLNATYASQDSKNSTHRKEIGLQIYSLGKELTDDVPNGMKRIANIGYRYIELAGYRDRKMGKYGMDEYRKIVEDAGLEIRSSHVNPPTREYNRGNVSLVTDYWKKTVEDHAKLGVTTLVQPGMPKMESYEDVSLVCGVFNHAGEIAYDAGIKWGYHNHELEFKRILSTKDKGKVSDRHHQYGDKIYDLMLDGTDPKLVFFEMDVYWAVMGQQDPLEYFEKYAGRFPALHIKDRSILGQSGMMNFKSIFTKADENGLDAFYVELESIKDGISQFKGVRECFNFINDAQFVK